MYHSLSLDTSDVSSSFFEELEEFSSRYYDEFDEEKVTGTLPLVASTDDFAYLDNVYGNSDHEEEETEVDDMTEDREMERLSQEMENEEALLQVRREFSEEDSGSPTPTELPSLCKTKSGRQAKLIMEGVDEEEKVGLLQFESGAEEFRRQDSYFSEEEVLPAWVPTAPTFKMDKFGNFVVARTESKVVSSPVSFGAPPRNLERAVTDHGNTMGGRVRFAPEPRQSRSNAIHRQATKHSSVNNRVRFAEQPRQMASTGITRQVTKHSSAKPRRIRFATGTKSCASQAVQRQVTRHTKVVMF